MLSANEALRSQFCRELIQLAAPRLPDRQENQQAQQDAGHAEHQEHGAPVILVVDHAGDVGAEPGADRRTEREDRQRHRAARHRKIIGDDRVRARRTPRFADADADARQQQLPVGPGESAERGHDRPADQAPRDDVASVAAVDQPRDRKTQHDIEQRKRHASQERDAGIGELQFEPDRFEHGRDDVPVGDAERVDQHHHDQHIPALHHRADPTVAAGLRPRLCVRDHRHLPRWRRGCRALAGRLDPEDPRDKTLVTKFVDGYQHRLQHAAIFAACQSGTLAPHINPFGCPDFFCCSRS